MRASMALSSFCDVSNKDDVFFISLIIGSGVSTLGVVGIGDLETSVAESVVQADFSPSSKSSSTSEVIVSVGNGVI
jgi:hypothetical protein